MNNYANHLSILEIQKTVQNTNMFYFKEVKEEEVLKLLKGINVKKSIGEDKIPPKLVKSAANYIYKSLTLITNQILGTFDFTNNAKRSAVTPLDKGTENKNDVVNNFRPVSVLIVFSKILENIIKNQLVPFIENQLSVFVSAYRSSYSSQCFSLSDRGVETETRQ